MTRWLARLTALWRRRRLEIELAEEMETHRLLKQAELERAGYAEGLARDESRRTMGNHSLMAEEARAVWVAPWLESLGQDLRYGVRGLIRNPAFASAALLSLGLAIGFNTSFFTLFNAVVLRPWPVTEPERVFTVWSSNPKGQGRRMHSGFSPAEARFLSQSARTISGLVVQRGEQVQVGEEVGPPISALLVSGNYFQLLGAPMSAGRGFLTSEDELGNPARVAVISHNLWKLRLGEDAEAVGKQIRVNGAQFTVAGITAPEFAGTISGSVDIFLPLSALPLVAGDGSDWARGLLLDPRSCCANVAIRLSNGATRDQAQSELAALHRQFLLGHGMESRGVQLERTSFMTPSQRIKVTPVFALFFLAVTFVLLLACANVANLTLARAVARQRELSIRLSIGAGRGRIVRQLLTESLLIAMAGSAMGVGIAWWLPGIILEYGIREPLALNLRPDLTVLTYTLLVALSATLLSGLAPALQATRASRFRLIQGTPAAVTGRFSLRGVMLGAQVALSVVLLSGSFLLLRATNRARALDLGFSVDGLQQAQLMLPINAYKPEQVRQFVESLDDVWNSRRVAVTNNPPLSFISNTQGVSLPGSAPGTPEISVQYLEVTPGYFHVLPVPLLRGRVFTIEDRARDVVVINERLATQFWPAGNAVGQLLRSGERSLEVVGVVRDVMTMGPGETPVTMYRPFTGSMPFLLWRQGQADPAAWQTAALRFDSRVRLQVSSSVEARSRWLRGSEVASWLTAGLGLFALALAGIGIYGTFSFAVEQRRREIGIRLSLGARTAQVLRTLLFSSGRAVLAGLAAGLMAAVALSRLLDGQLFGLSPLDPVSYALVLVVLSLAAGLATWAPALRAARVDPASSLRCD